MRDVYKLHTPRPTLRHTQNLRSMRMVSVFVRKYFCKGVPLFSPRLSACLCVKPRAHIVIKLYICTG
jgi:hypothetical protein